MLRRARRLACANSKWDAYFDHIAGESGVEVADYLVLAPKRSRVDRVTGVTILPVAAGRIVLQRVYRHPVEAWVWEAPRGFVDPGEAPETAALRELAEEVALACPAGRLMPLGLCAPETSTIIGKAALFAALDCTPGGRRDEEELGLGSVHTFTLEEALALADRSEIEDATTLAVLYRYARTAAP